MSVDVIFIAENRTHKSTFDEIGYHFNGTVSFENYTLTPDKVKASVVVTLPSFSDKVLEELFLLQV